MKSNHLTNIKEPVDSMNLINSQMVVQCDMPINCHVLIIKGKNQLPSKWQDLLETVCTMAQT